MTKTQSTLLDQLADRFDGSSTVRQQAWDMLADVGLPHRKSESYKYTQITAALEKKLDLDLHEADQSLSPRYKTSGSHLVIKNGVYSESDSVVQEGLCVQSQVVTEGTHDPFSLLNTVFAPEELLIETEGETEPVFLYVVNSIGFSNPRIRVRAKSNQEITVVEKSNNAPGSFSNGCAFFNLEKNASINYTKIQAYPSATMAHETVVADVSRDSRFYVNTYSFSGGLIRNNATLNLNDENCEGHMNGIYLLDGNSHVDNNTSVDHKMPNSYSYELYKGILDEKSKGVFNGKIYVRPDAQKTNAFQTNNNILLSDEATVNTKPQLEIWADDVKCSHGCTTGQLDEEAVFYLRSRGLSETSAKAMILNAFAAETLASIPVEEVKEELESLIHDKLS